MALFSIAIELPVLPVVWPVADGRAATGAVRFRFVAGGAFAPARALRDERRQTSSNEMTRIVSSRCGSERVVGCKRPACIDSSFGAGCHRPKHGPPSGMTQQLAATLTPADAALARLLERRTPLRRSTCRSRRRSAALPRRCRGTRPRCRRLNVAMADGWAMRARDLAGASSYAPLPLAAPPVWVEAGDRLPEGCDCVIDESAVEQAGPMFQVVAEAIPGEGVRRTGADFAAGASMLGGTAVAPADLIAARAMGRDALTRSPTACAGGEVPASDGHNHSAEFIAALVREAGARVTLAAAVARDVASIASAIGNGACDLLLLVGGSGVGRNDAAVDGAGEARAPLPRTGSRCIRDARPRRQRWHGSCRRHPRRAAQALSVWLALVQPLLDRLALREPRHATFGRWREKLPRRSALRNLCWSRAVDGQWMPLAAGDLPLGQIAAADAWLIVPGASEGYAEGTPVGALPLRDGA